MSMKILHNYNKHKQRVAYYSEVKARVYVYNVYCILYGLRIGLKENASRTFISLTGFKITTGHKSLI